MRLSNSILVVCTLSRPSSLSQCLRAAGSAVDRPRLAVVVSADQSSKTSDVLQVLATDLDWQILEVTACPGLARQRNLGIDAALNMDPSVEFIHFIDDDVLVSNAYFVEISKVFSEAPSAVAVGGRDVTSRPVRSTRIGLAIGTHSQREGALLRSGYNTGFKSKSGSIKVEWLSGCSQSFRMAKLKRVRFDPRIRFYGEEVDMHVRCAELGEIVFCAEAEFEHLFADEGRQDASEAIFWGDCARWGLCCDYPQRFRAGLLTLATIGHMVTSFFSWTLARHPQNLSYSRGHARFLIRLMSGTVPRDEAESCIDPSGARGLPVLHE